MVEEQNVQQKALVLIAQLYVEKAINDDGRDTLKEMIFNDDAILLSFFDRYDEEDELKLAIVKYSKGGALEANRPTGLGQPQQTDELDQISSPTDSALDMKKRKRLNQLAAEQERLKKAENEGTHGGMSITDCDLGASPQLNKGPQMKKGINGKYTPLSKAREFTLNKQ